MSNYLAIATVTATLQRILQVAIQQDLAGARVTTVKPDTNGSGTPEVGVNIYMYQVLPNPAWRNADLRSRRPKGDLSKQAQAGLDLYYLMTFYGNEVELEPQRLLGSTVRTLIDQPILTQEMIRETVYGCDFLEGSTLAEQVEKVSLTPIPMNTEELSKIWSIFFQTPYILSFAYQGSTVLIEGDKPGKSGLPVKSRRFFVVIPNQPSIEEVVSEEGINRLFLLGDTIIIRGQRLQGDHVKIKIGEAIITPQHISVTQIRCHLPSLPLEERDRLKAGVQSLQVLHCSTPDETRNNSEGVAASNIVPFVLAVTIQPNEIEVYGIKSDNNLCTAEVTVGIDLIASVEQRVFLLLNERASINPAAYVFSVRSRTEQTRSLAFTLKDVKPGEYLVRVQIDGSESSLEIDPESNSDEYVSPTLEIR